MRNTYPLVDLLTARSLALLAARYSAQVAAACRRSLPPALSHWDAPTDPEVDRVMRERPVGIERRVA